MKNLTTTAELETAVEDYRNPKLKVVEIAQKHKISVQELSARIDASGVPRRSRGRQPATNPPAHSKRVLDYAVLHGFSKAAKHFNISKQCVSSLAKRWGVPPPSRITNATTLIPKRERKQRRDLLVCFRLRATELSLLRESLPESVKQSTNSPHKLVRAAILQRLENLGRLQNGAAPKTPNSSIPVAEEKPKPNSGSPIAAEHEATITNIR